jgi:hypothetical protein
MPASATLSPLADRDGNLGLTELAKYSGLSVRTLRTYLDGAPGEALPCFRVGGKIVVKRSEFDAWMEQFRSRGRPSLARAMQDLGLTP